MTVEELARLPSPSVSPQVASELLGCDRYALNIAAKRGQLGLKYFFSGNRLHISKQSLLDYLGWEGGKPSETRLFQPTQVP